MVSIIFCLFILFNEYFIIIPTIIITNAIAMNIALIGNTYCDNILISKALNMKYDNTIPIGIPNYK